MSTKTPIDRFFYWVKERHNIYKLKEAGKPKPWTDDPVLQKYFFTNPYRENDKVTKWFRENIRDPLKSKPEVFFATVLFRWFNKPDPTGNFILKHNLHLKWREKFAVKNLKEIWNDGEQPVFTGAFMIKAGNGPRGSKIPSVCNCITNVWRERWSLVKFIGESNSMEESCRRLQEFPGLGSFMSYEIVCDLRYTYLLKEAKDKMTWCNIGPGARRGMNRILGKEVLESNIPKEVWNEETQRLLKLSRKCRLGFEMREIEHSLCEFDKYERARNGETSKMKRTYNGVSER